MQALLQRYVMKPGKTTRALVTGAGSGLGRELCLELARRGGRILAVDWSEQRARETLDLVRQAGGSGDAVCQVGLAPGTCGCQYLRPRTLSFADPLATAESAVRQLKDQGADLVIALTHLDIAEDRAIAAKVKGLDLLLGGHDHDPITFLENGKLILKAGSDAHWLAVVDLAVERVEQGGKPAVRWTPSWRYVANVNVPPHPQIKPIVDRWNERLDKELAVPIGEIAVPLDSRRDAVRTAETAIGNLIADAMRLAMNADVAITNGGGIRGDRTYPAGTVLTRKDILTELPFGNVTVLVEGNLFPLICRCYRL